MMSFEVNHELYELPEEVARYEQEYESRHKPECCDCCEHKPCCPPDNFCPPKPEYECEYKCVCKRKIFEPPMKRTKCTNFCCEPQCCQCKCCCQCKQEQCC